MSVHILKRKATICRFCLVFGYVGSLFPSQDAFEGVAGEYRVELHPDQRELLPLFCEEIPLEKLGLLLEMLFECIMLTITVPRGTDDDDLDMTKVG
jgi:hypothetical protein